MKLRNKKTGEIMDDVQYRNYSLSDGFGFRMNGKEWEYHSLAEFNEEWEDYEPKEFYFIDQFMSVSKGVVDDVEYAGRHNAVNYAKKTSNNLKTAGNYFEAREEAEKAVEKLKALKRLKDKGFRFVGWRGDVDKHHLDGVVWYEMRLCGGYNIETANDLETIFGPEEKE